MTDDYSSVSKPPMRTLDGVSLRDYVDRRFEECQTYRNRQETALENRLLSMNEIREAMRDQAKDYLTRSEYEAKHDALSREIKVLREWADVNRGKASQNSVIFAYAIGIISLMVSIIGHFMK